MLISKTFKGQYIKADQLDGQRQRLTIAGVEMASFADGTSKPVLRFDESDQGLVLNRTNAEAIAVELGDNTDGWIGKQVVLVPERVRFNGKLVACIRVKVPENPPSAATTTAASDEVA